MGFRVVLAIVIVYFTILVTSFVSQCKKQVNEKFLTCERIVKGDTFSVTKNITVKKWIVNDDLVYDLDTNAWFVAEKCHPIEMKEK